MILQTALILGAAVGQPAAPPRPAASSPASATPLSQRVAALLEQGRLDEALREAQHAYLANPTDPTIREEFIGLHLSLSRRLMQERQYAGAQRTAQAVLKAEPNQPEATRIVKQIAAARSEAPQRTAEARRWLALEWFEAAYEALDDACGLLPERRSEWTADLLAAAEGSGDDHYFCKNFHPAFYYYDAVMRSGRRVDESLTRRWLQCLVFSLADDVDLARYPPAYWKKIIADAEARAGGRATAMEVLRALAAENAGDASRAAEAYARITSGIVVGDDPAAVRAQRLGAIALLRRQYDESLSPRRNGIWKRSDPGDWRSLERRRFRVQHRNDAAAQRVADALEFHFDRTAAFLRLRPQAIPWAMPCTIYLHRDGAALRAATRQNGALRATSVIRSADGRLESHAVHLSQDDPLLLASTLPHEIMHLVLAALAGYRPTSAALNEGLALHCEPRCRNIQFARVLAQEGGPQSLAALLAVKEPHPTGQRRFYGQTYALVDVLLSRGSATQLTAVMCSPDPGAEAVRQFGFGDPATLEAAWHASVSTKPR